MNHLKRTFSVIVLMLIVVIQLSGQSNYLKQIERHDLVRAEKWLIKDIAKKPEDIEINFCMAILLKEQGYKGYDLESSYKYFIRSKQLYEQNIDQKIIKRLDKIPLNQELISNYIDTVCRIALKLTVDNGNLESYQKYLDYYTLAPLPYKQKAIEKRNELAYINAKNLNSLESYEYFISTYPEALQVYKAISNRNHIAYENAKLEDNIIGYQAFISKYRDAVEVNQAKDRIQELAFEQTKKINTSVAYNSFINEYPKSKHVKQAFDLYEKTQYKENIPIGSSWKVYVHFIENYPENSLKTIAYDSIISYIKQSNDIDATNYCIENFKDSNRLKVLTVYHDFFTSDGEKKSLDLFYEKYDEDALSEIKTKDYEIAELGDALNLSMPYDSLRFSDYDSYIRLAAPREKAFVALQRIISPYIQAKNWKSAIEKVNEYAPFFGNDFKKTKDLVSILKNDIDKSIKITSLGPGINTEAGGEYVPVISADDKLLYFCGRERPDNIGGEDIFVSRKIKGVWTQAKIVPDLSTRDMNDAPLSISADGTSMLLFKSGEIYYANKTKKGWSEPIRFPDQINGGKWQADAMITSDGKSILFASTKPGGFNKSDEDEVSHGDTQYASDIYVSTLNENNEWGEPINLGSTINTAYCDRSPFLHPDMKTLYFSSDGHGGLGKLDVYKSTRLADSCWNCWSEPINMGKEFNNQSSDWCYKISTNGDVAYFSKTNNTGKNIDIYSVNIPKYLRPGLVATITGKLIDKNNQPISSEIRWEDLETGKNVGQSKSDPADGSFFIVLPIGKIYGYYVDENTYFPLSNHIDLRNNKVPTQVEENINMVTFKQMIEDGTAVPVNNLFFNFSESGLLPFSLPELKRVATIIKANNLKVEISGHTDNIGDDKKNQLLSEQRALAVKEYFISEGCKGENFVTVGYGKTRPVATNETEEGRYKNRRVELKFIK